MKGFFCSLLLRVLTISAAVSCIGLVQCGSISARTPSYVPCYVCSKPCPNCKEYCKCHEPEKTKKAKLRHEKKKEQEEKRKKRAREAQKRREEEEQKDREAQAELVQTLQDFIALSKRIDASHAKGGREFQADLDALHAAALDRLEATMQKSNEFEGAQRLLQDLDSEDPLGTLADRGLLGLDQVKNDRDFFKSLFENGDNDLCSLGADCISAVENNLLGGDYESFKRNVDRSAAVRELFEGEAKPIFEHYPVNMDIAERYNFDPSEMVGSDGDLIQQLAHKELLDIMDKAGTLGMGFSDVSEIRSIEKILTQGMHSLHESNQEQNYRAAFGYSEFCNSVFNVGKEFAQFIGTASDCAKAAGMGIARGVTQGAINFCKDTYNRAKNHPIETAIDVGLLVCAPEALIAKTIFKGLSNYKELYGSLTKEGKAFYDRCYNDPGGAAQQAVTLVTELTMGAVAYHAVGSAGRTALRRVGNALGRTRATTPTVAVALVEDSSEIAKAYNQYGRKQTERALKVVNENPEIAKSCTTTGEVIEAGIEHIKTTKVPRPLGVGRRGGSTKKLSKAASSSKKNPSNRNSTPTRARTEGSAGAYGNASTAARNIIDLKEGADYAKASGTSIQTGPPPTNTIPATQIAAPACLSATGSTEASGNSTGNKIKQEPINVDSVEGAPPPIQIKPSSPTNLNPTESRCELVIGKPVTPTRSQAPQKPPAKSSKPKTVIQQMQKLIEPTKELLDELASTLESSFKEHGMLTPAALKTFYDFPGISCLGISVEELNAYGHCWEGKGIVHTLLGEYNTPGMLVFEDQEIGLLRGLHTWEGFKNFLKMCGLSEADFIIEKLANGARKITFPKGKGKGFANNKAWKKCAGIKTLWPEHYTLSNITEAALEIINSVCKIGDSYTGLTSNGIMIKVSVDANNKIKSAFPFGY